MNGRGVLLDQLPAAVAADPVLAGFVHALQDVVESVLDRVDGLENQFDPGVANPSMVVRLGTWVGLDADFAAGPAGPAAAVGEHERDLVRRIGALQGWRGTRTGLQRLAAALTGTTAQVQDSGGVHGIGVVPPRASRTVTVRVSRTGPLTRERLVALLEAELPVGVRLELQVGRRPAGSEGGRP